MTDFTRDIKPINVSNTPQLQTPTSSAIADAANLVSTGFDLFTAAENEKREAKTSRMVQSLRDFEVELTQNERLSRTDVLSRLDKRIKTLVPDASQQSFLRTELAKARGGFVQNQLIQTINNEETQRAAKLEADYQQALQFTPNLYSTVKMDSQGMVTDEEKVRIIQESQKSVLAKYQAQQKQAEAEAQLARGGVEALEGAVNLSSAVNALVGEDFRALADQYVSFSNSLDIQSTENAILFEEAGSNLRNVFGMLRSRVESQYSKAFTASNDDNVRKILKDNQESTQKILNSIEKTLSSNDISQVKKLASQVEYIQTNLKLSGLRNFELLSIFEEIMPTSGAMLTKAMVAKRPDLLSAAERELVGGLTQLASPESATMQLGSDLASYAQNPDPAQHTDNTLSTFYEYAKSVINSSETMRELSSIEQERVSGGLLGILSEAAATDDPQQIREATKMLTSENFTTFFNQLPEERKAAMGRFVSSFAEDVLIDRTDGLIKKLSDRKGDADISYNANTGMFEAKNVEEVSRNPFSYGIQKEGSTGFQSISNKRAIEKEVEQANLYLSKIRDMSKYDPSGLDSNTYVDTLLAKYLPADIKVSGKLKPFEEDVTDSNVVDESTRLDNEVVIRELQSKITELESKLLQ
jgi:hypothetical protein